MGLSQSTTVEPRSIDEELAARLRNMATRVRKSVTEGYAPSAPGAPNIPRITSRLPFTRSASFQSANDALKDAYASHATMLSPRGDDDDDDDIDLDGDASDLRIPAGQFQANDSMRPVKPLPAARRGGMRSFSEGALPYGRRTNAH
ncbi:uncharacterized protein B0H18DRAFT_1205520 [Fomitopsis serialis]|uniref:uncharacterized protein n=1 Tax=Fomitopsis serialis TaxID=139415 RepID=UPI002007EBF2|nr:uncharacterized protein B0H18DRAFT_1205520 [Neoantrodia serialis]KAH9938247.1 hypothetical protein B0H18DRAFT_1205520 [Neoantrodia serialis]